MNNTTLSFLLIIFFSCSASLGRNNNELKNKFVASLSETVDKDEITVLTYNVMGSQFKPNERIPALINIIVESGADVVALQEIDRGFAEALMNDSAISKAYLYSNNLTNHIKGGLLFLSKFKMNEVSYHYLPETRLNRFMLTMKVVINNELIHFTTVHLDSYLEDGERRAKQLDFIFDKLKKHKNNIILGDFNFGDLEQPETSYLDSSYTDIWIELNPKKKGYTWNMEQNNMALQGSFLNEKSRRLDRIIMNSKSWAFRSCKMIGNHPLIQNSKDLFPSDHYGLIGTIFNKKNK